VAVAGEPDALCPRGVPSLAKPSQLIPFRGAARVGRLPRLQVEPHPGRQSLERQLRATPGEAVTTQLFAPMQNNPTRRRPPVALELMPCGPSSGESKRKLVSTVVDPILGPGLYVLVHRLRWRRAVEQGGQ
jgi:hypothetical protein